MYSKYICKTDPTQLQKEVKRSWNFGPFQGDLGGSDHLVKLDDCDEYFDLDGPEYMP